MMKEFKYLLKGEELTVTVGKYAEQANGACMVRHGDTVLLATATCAKKPREGIDFFPLSCDFQDKLYAVGKIPGGFIKREGRPTDRAILISRLIDRPLRPLFPDGFRNEVQVIATPFSVDQDHMPDVLAMTGASIALTISDIPFAGPTAAVSVGYVDGEYIINPTEAENAASDLHLTVAGTKDAIMMVEAGANILSEEQVLEAILFGHEEIKKLCAFIEEIQAEVGKEKMEIVLPERNEALESDVRAYATPKIIEALKNTEKTARQKGIDTANDETKEHFADIYPEDGNVISGLLDDILQKEIRRKIIHEHVRPDDRALDEIRPITCEAGIMPRTHGSGLFKRGQTQVLSLLTLGAPGDAQMLDGMLDQDEKRYMHQYNFPPFCVGDTRPLRGPGRREVGHGHLAERALLPVLPDEKDFPYTIRVVSEVLSSNGSSSQASVCGSTLSLMDAGVPIKAPVAGIAMGLIEDEETKDIAILTDIQGLEDHFGDMDFKVAGTSEGITAIQMDIKIHGISKEILTAALEQARKGRLFILGKMHEAIEAPRADLSAYAPRILTIQIEPDKVREVIGPGGKVINDIIAKTGVKIDTEDDGFITVTGPDGPSGEKAIEMIKAIVKEVEPGEIYEGPVKRIMNFGAFVEIANGKEGLVHISNLAHTRTEKVEDVVKIGDIVRVVVTEIDNQGRINLSMKALMPKPEGFKEEDNRQGRSDRDNRGNRRGGHGRNRREHSPKPYASNDEKTSNHGDTNPSKKPFYRKKRFEGKEE